MVKSAKNIREGLPSLLNLPVNQNTYWDDVPTDDQLVTYIETSSLALPKSFDDMRWEADEELQRHYFQQTAV